MKKIKLTKGKHALVDNEDYEYLNQFRWFVRKHRYTFYASRRIYRNNKMVKNIDMHQEIMGKYPKLKPEIDHINRNGLNNCRKNLRFVSNQENQRNRKINSNNTSGYKGIYWNKRNKKWQAYAYIDYKSIYIGLYKDIKDAIKNRKEFIKNNYN